MATEQGTNSPADPTYRQYTREQAATYAKHRPSPPPALVKLILDYHTSTGGCTDVLLDVGCGPGMATRALAKHFDVAVGSDAGESMIQVANELGGQTATGGQIRWVVCPAEEVGQIDGVEKQTVDLVVAAYAAHWFDMPKFWAATAEVLKAGGTVALWTGYREAVDSTSPEEAKVHAIFAQFHTSVLDAYAVPGTKLSRDAYRDLLMPWEDASTAPFFDRTSFLRHELSRKDLSPTPVPTTAAAIAADPLAPQVWQRVLNMLNTMDAVTRWREAHPDLAGTERDCVTMLVEDTKEALREGNTKIDFGRLLLGMKTVLLLVKRS